MRRLWDFARSIWSHWKVVMTGPNNLPCVAHLATLRSQHPGLGVRRERLGGPAGRRVPAWRDQFERAEALTAKQQELEKERAERIPRPLIEYEFSWAGQMHGGSPDAVAQNMCPPLTLGQYLRHPGRGSGRTARAVASSAAIARLMAVSFRFKFGQIGVQGQRWLLPS